MIEDELRASFARHEPLAPEVGPLRRTIDRLAARRRRQRLMTRAGAVAVVAALALATPPLVMDRFAPVPPVALDPAMTPAPQLRPGPLNLLLLGLDPNSAETGTRTDTVVLVHVPADHSAAYLLSIERDIMVDVPGHGKQRLNAAYALGGAALTTSTVEKMMGITVDGTMTVSFGAVRGITDALGGIDVCLPEEVRSIHTRRVYPAACQHLNGSAALDVLRQRHNLEHGAYDRDRNGQRVLLALAGRMTDLNVLTDMLKVSSLLGVRGVGLDLHRVGGEQLVAVFAKLGPEDLVGLGQPTFNAAPGQSGFERIDPRVAPALFEAVRSDTMGGFAARHPAWVLQK